MEWRLILRYPEGKDKRLRQQTAVAELGHKALTGNDVEALMAEAALAVAGNLEVQYCSVMELLPEGEALVARAGVGWSDEDLGKQTVGPGSDSQAGYTLASGGR